MFGLLGKTLALVKESCVEKAANVSKISHTRVSSYIILGSILTNSLIFMGIEVTNAVMMYKQLKTYTVPTEHIFIFGMILSHHIALLFTKEKTFVPTTTYDLGTLKGESTRTTTATTATTTSEVITDNASIDTTKVDNPDKES
jgi:hypothetical protein